jgi:hypothetical protein
MAFPEIVLHGFWYSGTILFILGAHEFGHYLACRYYQVDASLPFFIPLPLPPTGTMGAVIKIREPFPNKVVLFDVGVAGPLAGFAVALPALFLRSHVSLAACRAASSSANRCSFRRRPGSSGDRLRTATPSISTPWHSPPGSV